MTQTDTKQNYVDIRLLDFDGFYCSHSLDRLENVETQLLQDICNNEVLIKDKTFSDESELADFIHENTTYDFKGYAKNWAENLYTDILHCELPELFPKPDFLQFKELYSPKYYNYSTDEITAQISPDLMARIQQTVLKEYPKEFCEYLKDHFTDYDGFMSNYPNNPAEFCLIDDEITRGVYLQVLRQATVDDDKLVYDIYEQDCAYEYVNFNFEYECN